MQGNRKKMKKKMEASSSYLCEVLKQPHDQSMSNPRQKSCPIVNLKTNALSGHLFCQTVQIQGKKNH